MNECICVCKECVSNLNRNLWTGVYVGILHICVYLFFACVFRLDEVCSLIQIIHLEKCHLDVCYFSKK